MKNVDLHQIELLCRLLDTQSLGEAARQMAMTSPAASQSLARLRDAFPADVYRRQGNAYELTPYGRDIIDSLRTITRRWEALRQSAQRFDPAACELRFAVACVAHAAVPDPVALYERFRSLAPHAQLDLQVPLHNAFDLPALRAGKLDVLCPSAPAPADARDLHQELLCRHHITHVILRRSHPRIGDGLTLEQYLAEQHLVAHYRNLDPASRSPLDAALQAMGLPPRRSTYVQSLWTCLHLVTQSDFLLTMSSEGAQTLVRSLPQLRSLPLPAEMPPVHTRLHMVWHERTHHSAAHRWLRELLREAVRPPAMAAPAQDAGAV